MRSNFFGEQIAQPDDSVNDVKVLLDDKGFVPTSADLNAEDDETYHYGGELRDDDGEAFAFDGFKTLNEAREFAKQFVDEDEITVVD